MAQINLDQAGLQQLIQQAVQQAIQAMNVPPPPPPPPPPQAPFALVPGGATAGALPPWDFSSGDGLKLFMSSTKALEPKFDGSQANLIHFLEQVQDRADSFGWTNIMRITDDNNTTRKLTTEYGTLTHANMLASANTYMTLNGRSRQASNCLQLFIKASIDSSVMIELSQLQHKYSIVVNNETRIDGPMMLYQLIGMVAIETRATISSITDKLGNLAALMEEEKSNVKNFNTKVNLYVLALQARDAPVPDIITQLFKAYKNCGDAAFAKYIETKEDLYLDRSVDYDRQQLMRLALEKYKTIEQTGKWLQKSEEQLEFIAMKAELQTQIMKLADKKPKLKQNTEKGPRKARANTGKWAWKSITPKPGEAHKKTVDGKAYIHCPHHGDTQWVLEVNREGVEHATGCRARQNSKEPATPTTLSSTISTLTPSTVTQKQLLYAQALATVLAEEGGKKLALEADEEDEDE
jgi:hypothetical protein